MEIKVGDYVVFANNKMNQKDAKDLIGLIAVVMKENDATSYASKYASKQLKNPTAFWIKMLSTSHDSYRPGITYTWYAERFISLGPTLPDLVKAIYNIGDENEHR